MKTDKFFFLLICIASMLSAIPKLQAEEAKAVMITIDGGISPATADYLAATLEEAEKADASLFLIQLNTPGGLLDATRDIVSELLQSDIPTCVYIGPSGARAGSAGAFISLATDVIAMAPGTNIGAAHPVGLGGESGDSSDVMTQKVTNDAAALIRSIAQKKGRDIEIAEAMVRESISISEDEAMERGIADIIAKDVSELMSQLRGYKIANASIETKLPAESMLLSEREPDWKESFLLWLADPNIAYIFILLAGAGFMIELYNPGSIFPGAIGVVSALLAAFSLDMLPVNWIGFALLVASGILIILEIFVTSYGMLSVGAVITFFLGSIMLFDSPEGMVELSMTLVWTLTVLLALSAAAIIYFALNSQKRKRVSGSESLSGERGRALSDIEAKGSGKIRFHGENWRAINEGDEAIAAGSEVTVVRTESLTAFVRKGEGL